MATQQYAWLVVASAILMGGCATTSDQVCPAPMAAGSVDADRANQPAPDGAEVASPAAPDRRAALDDRKVKMMERKLKEREREIAALTVQLETLKQIDTDRTRKRPKADAAFVAP